MTGLVGDIGGTNARFALVEQGSINPHTVQVCNCADFPSLPHAIEAYLGARTSGTITQAVIAVATPVTGDRLLLTNNSWSFSRTDIEQQFGFSSVRFINDFTVQALAVPLLAPAQLRQIGGGTARPGEPIAVVGPGTGLGVSGLLLVEDGTRMVPLEGEGGHASLGARTAREYRVIEEMRLMLGHVSAERFLSGPGLSLIVGALQKIDGAKVENVAPDQVTARALGRSDPLCVEALEMFCAQLGSFSADLALTIGAKGGVYISGGIVPQLGEHFDMSGFREAFEQKGRMSGYLQNISTSVMLAENPALLGAASLLVEEWPK